MRTNYKRILLKLSGESLMGSQGYGIDPARVGDYAEQIKEIAQSGVEIAIVIGGGNIFRGLAGAAKGVDRATRWECLPLSSIPSPCVPPSKRKGNRHKCSQPSTCSPSASITASGKQSTL